MLKELLRDTFAYIQPAAALEGLTDGQATRRVHDAPHSIAEVVAHLTFWQDWFLARCSGDPRPMIASAADGWPPVAEGEWPALNARFLAGLDAAVALAEDSVRLADPIDPPIEFPPMAEYTRHDALAHLAVHNAHHLGQIVTLRQLAGRWPPPAGPWTW